MSILSWLKSVTEGGVSTDLIQTQPIQFATGEEEFHGLDMREALDAHLAWTHRLAAQLDGTADEDLEVADVACDDRCKLGKWLHGAAKGQFAGNTHYNALRKTHADFHLKAGEVLNEVKNGNEASARSGLKIIRRESGNVQLALVRLYSDFHS